MSSLCGFVSNYTTLPRSTSRLCAECVHVVHVCMYAFQEAELSQPVGQDNAAVPQFPEATQQICLDDSQMDLKLGGKYGESNYFS